jgi:flagellar motor switch protein FliG
MSRPADAYRKEQNAAKKAKAKAKLPVDPGIRGFIKETSRDTGYRKAAQFLMLLGKDEAARVLRHLAPEEVEGITLEIARTQHIESREASKILEEFGYIRETKDLIAAGGIDKAEEMLVNSLGREKADEILARVKKEMAPPPFSFLQDIDFHQVVSLMKEESPPVIALILAHLDPRLAARILAALSPDVQKETVPRIAKLSKVDPEVVRKAEETLRSKVREKGTVVTEDVNGKGALTEILRFMDPAREAAILEDLDPNTAEEIKKSLFTQEVVFRIPDKDFQKALHNYADRELALMLKGADENFTSRILESVSERRREFIKMEMEATGPVLKSKVNQALDDFLGYLQLLEQKGEIIIPREREELVE